MSEVQKLSAVVRSQAKAQHRFMEVMMFDKLTGGGEVGERQQIHLNGGIETIIASPSVELICGIVDDGTALDSEVSLLKDTYQVAKDRGSDSLGKEAARMLGSLMLKSDSKPEEIEFLEDDLQYVFSSKAYPQLINEDDFFDKMEAAFMWMGPSEAGLPAAIKEKLLALLDLPMLTYSVTRRVERYLRHNQWGPPLLADMRLREFVRPKREYKLEPPAVVVTEANLRDDVTRNVITDRFSKEPDTKCILDVSGFLNDSGKLLTNKLEHLPLSVRCLSCINGGCCTTIGDDFLKQHPSLTTVDFSCLQRVTAVGRNFLSQCNSLTSLHLPEELHTVGQGFLNGCDSLNMDISQYKSETAA
eukprot:TRINITY_DN1716_c1_g2_i2.p1 TRINITY_DN1716_c1_g2~~TRINITY_DN1716_c1_g2_i2.p1  ORF type:complete len:359 (+),score=76.36 TRINITY_DN1716_c1_g2_i2:789-1865(+)